MESPKKITFKDLKPHIADAIKESAYTTNMILYRIANEVHNIATLSTEPGVEIVEGLSKVIDRTIKDSMDLGCNLSAVVKGIMVGAFRSSHSITLEAHKTIHLLINETMDSVFRHHGNAKQAVEGFLAAMVIITKENNLNTQEALKITKEEILYAAQRINPKFADDIKEVLSDD